MRKTVGFVLRRFAADLPWLVPMAASITLAFALVPMVIDGRPFGESVETAAALSIGMLAILPTVWLRFRVIRELGGRRTVVAMLMALAWAAAVLIAAMPFLASLDA